MPRAKAKYDTDGSWKNRVYGAGQWAAIEVRLQAKLRPFYPDKNAVVDPQWGHPADEWARRLLAAAYGAVDMEHWLGRRLTNEELRAEQQDLLATVKKTAERLGAVSHDLKRLFDYEVDLLGPQDKLKELIPHIEAIEANIAAQPKAQKSNEVNQAAALEMAIRALRVLKEAGGSIAATVDKDLGYISDAVRILKIVGDELGLALDETVWKKVIIKAKNEASDLR